MERSGQAAGGALPHVGRRHQAVMPDTLDLTDRAALATNGIVGAMDPNLHYQMLFLVRYAGDPPPMQHSGADATCDPKFGESLPMMRIMCGSDRFLDVELAQPRCARSGRG